MNNHDEQAVAYSELFQLVKDLAADLPEPGTKEMTPQRRRATDFFVHELNKGLRKLKSAHGFKTTGRKRFPLSPLKAQELAREGVPVARIARDHGLSRTTVYKLLREVPQ